MTFDADGRKLYIWSEGRTSDDPDCVNVFEIAPLRKHAHHFAPEIRISKVRSLGMVAFSS